MSKSTMLIAGAAMALALANIDALGGIRQTRSWHGFYGRDRGRPTPRNRRRMNVKHAKRRARHARAAR